MKYKLESKDMDIKELKKLVKMKQEELSEMQASHDRILPSTFWRWSRSEIFLVLILFLYLIRIHILNSFV